MRSGDGPGASPPQTQGSLRLVLGDQISDGRLSSLRDLDPRRDVVLLAEVMSEASYVRHHKQKFALVFSGMRQFADRLRDQGAVVRYVRLDDPANTHSLNGEVLRALEDQPFGRVVVTEPGEWRLVQAFDELAHVAAVPVEMRPDDRFICSRAEFEAWANDGRGELRMEFFYRLMRRKTGLLMDGDKPTGGRWNFDAENRKRLPKGKAIPPRHMIEPNGLTRQVMGEMAARFPDNFGTMEGFNFPTNPQEAEAALDHFITRHLPEFGDWQDFMKSGEPWMWHAHISAGMNLGLIDPLDACRRAEAEYRAGRAPVNAVEGFVRQILGWREYVRGVYWLKGPDYRTTNALQADRRLPWSYWSAETRMACVADVVAVTRDHAYAHHIQRLMVTGNLAMLLGVHPDEINDWYMVVYADAYEWVELPNTHGMATFADGGVMSSKPYAGSGAYINRMSDYCGGCAYDVKDRLGDNACPFNALYWDFLIRNRARLGANPRMSIPYAAVDRMGADDVEAIGRKAESLKEKLGATRR
ncbi:cryptochrome/photolyase family protein [Caulobacter sp. S45]|uniref:cryptochrome/photolyase family protein n=1 Tax=Caulobacter sp. S45 TaxID=1641861 RepID=UPI0020C5E257|nr:cryptochrome/photolyase family protein [Caulobacter sp. S45]